MARGSFVADGNITPCTFVKLNTAATAGHVLQAGAGDTPYGVSSQSDDQPPLAALDSGNAAVAGETLRVYTGADPEDEPYMQVDAAYNVGTQLKPNSSGVGTTVTSATDVWGAIMLEPSTAANQLVRVSVRAPQYYGS